MQYSLDNVTISMFQALALHLRSIGWNVYWHASGDTDAFTGGSDQGTITLIQHVPENPTFLTADAGAYANKDNVVIPAFTINAQLPRKIRRLGLGHTQYEREMDLVIGGISTDSRQQAILASALYEWLDIEDTNYYMPISDYSTPSAPVALDPAEMWFAKVSTHEVASEVDSTRYQIHIEIILRFVE